MSKLNDMQYTNSSGTILTIACSAGNQFNLGTLRGCSSYDPYFLLKITGGSQLAGICVCPNGNILVGGNVQILWSITPAGTYSTYHTSTDKTIYSITCDSSNILYMTGTTSQGGAFAGNSVWSLTTGGQETVISALTNSANGTYVGIVWCSYNSLLYVSQGSILYSINTTTYSKTQLTLTGYSIVYYWGLASYSKYIYCVESTYLVQIDITTNVASVIATFPESMYGSLAITCNSAGDIYIGSLQGNNIYKYTRSTSILSLLRKVSSQIYFLAIDSSNNLYYDTLLNIIYTTTG